MGTRTRKSWKQRVLEFFQSRPDGATADEAVQHFGDRNYSNVTARITNMVNGLAPKLFGTGRFRRTRRGRQGQVLIATNPLSNPTVSRPYGAY